MSIILISMPTKSRTQSLFCSSHNSLDLGDFYVPRRDFASRDDLIVAWRATGGSEEVKKGGRETKGFRCRKRRIARVSAERERKKRGWERGESSELWQMSITTAHTDAHTTSSLVLTRSQIARPACCRFIV